MIYRYALTLSWNFVSDPVPDPEIDFKHNRNYPKYYQFYNFAQGCGSGSGLEPDSMIVGTRVRNGNSDPGSGSMGKKIKKKCTDPKP
jgi:hypothetical protein